MTWHNMNETEFDDYFGELYDDKKNQRQLFFETDRGLVLGSLVGEYEEYYMSKMSFEDFLKVIESSIIEPVDYIDYLIGNPTATREAHDNDFEFMKEVDYKTLEAYVDYKRGYEIMLYIYELDYKAFGIKPPKKTERDYLGVRFTHYQHGEITDFEISRYKQRTKKITVKEWQPV
jgi:hypothetical protein